MGRGFFASKKIRAHQSESSKLAHFVRSARIFWTPRVFRPISVFQPVREWLENSEDFTSAFTSAFAYILAFAAALALMQAAYADSLSIDLKIPDESYENSSLNSTANLSLILQPSSLNATINLTTVTNASNFSITIGKYNRSIEGAIPNNFNATFFLTITADNLTADFNATIKAYYNSSNLAKEAGNIDENTLKIYFWNSTLQQWAACVNSSWNRCINSGNDTSSSLIWANVIGFSSFGVFGNITVPVITISSSAGETSSDITATTNENATCRYADSDASYGVMSGFSITGGTSHNTTINGLSKGTSYTYYTKCQNSAGNIGSKTVSFTTSGNAGGNNGGGGGGGGGGSSDKAKKKDNATATGCVEDWVCFSWQECLDGLQSRECFDQNSCGTTANKPIAERLCAGSQSQQGKGDFASAGSGANGADEADSGFLTGAATVDIAGYKVPLEIMLTGVFTFAAALGILIYFIIHRKILG